MSAALVNAHTHLELSALASLRPSTPGSLPAWLAEIGAELRQRDRQWLVRSCEKGIEQLHSADTTHVGDVSWSGASVAPLVASGLKGLVWIELRGLLPAQGEQRLAQVQRMVGQLREVAAGGSIDVGVEVHAPYTLHPSLWEPTLRWLENERLSLSIHVAESPAEWALFVQGRGELRLYESMMSVSPFPPMLRYPIAFIAARARGVFRALGYSYPLSRGQTPVEYLERHGALAHRPFLVHAVEVNGEDIERIRRCGATVVHCPRSNQSLGCGRMPLERFLAAGVRVLLGTDSLASASTLNVRDEVAAAIELHRGKVPPDAISALAAQSVPLAPNYSHECNVKPR